MNLIKNSIVIISAVIDTYIIINLIIDSKKIKQNEDYKSRKYVYIVLITVLLIGFVLYGILRNF